MHLHPFLNMLNSLIHLSVAIQASLIKKTISVSRTARDPHMHVRLLPRLLRHAEKQPALLISDHLVILLPVPFLVCRSEAV